MCRVQSINSALCTILNSYSNVFRQAHSLSNHSGTNLIFDGTLRANNSLIIRAQVGMDEDGITCTSDNTSCCDDAQGSGSGWFSPSGEPLHEGLDGATTLYLTRGPGFVRLNRITGGTSALYWCEVPDFNGVIHRFYVGLYTGTLISGI